MNHLPVEHTLTHLARMLTGALRARIDTDGWLHDPETAAPTPTQHYGQLSAALAFLLWEEHRPAWRPALDAWLATPRARLGHEPFNRFLLLTMRARLDVLPATAADTRAIARGLARCPPRARYPSNNWHLLAQLCRLLAAPPRRRARETRALNALLARWIGADGAFIDYPRAPGRTGATPLTYHYKALFVATVAAGFVDDATLAGHLTHLLRFAVRQGSSADGHLAGFGRSTHVLFADACFLASLTLLRAHELPAGQALIAGIARRLRAQLRPDGLYWLNPAGDTASWDEYMFLSVYNAWFAALVSWAVTCATLPRSRSRTP